VVAGKYTVKWDCYQNCSMLCCVQQYAHKYEQLIKFRVRLFLCVFKGLFCIFVCFCVSLNNFGFVLLVNFVGFGFFSI